MDKIRNIKYRPESNKIEEGQLRWYGYMKRLLKKNMRQNRPRKEEEVDQEEYGKRTLEKQYIAKCKVGRNRTSERELDFPNFFLHIRVDGCND